MDEGKVGRREEEGVRKTLPSEKTPTQRTPIKNRIFFQGLMRITQRTFKCLRMSPNFLPLVPAIAMVPILPNRRCSKKQSPITPTCTSTSTREESTPTKLGDHVMLPKAQPGVHRVGKQSAGGRADRACADHQTTKGRCDGGVGDEMTAAWEGYQWEEQQWQVQIMKEA